MCDAVYLKALFFLTSFLHVFMGVAAKYTV